MILESYVQALLKLIEKGRIKIVDIKDVISNGGRE